jgi:hypothetical protein
MDQTDVTGMEVTHGRHESDRLPLPTQRRNSLSQLIN